MTAMEHNRENLLKLIRSGLEINKLSIAALERTAGVAKDTIRDFLRGKTQILRADKLQKILRVLHPEEKVSLTSYVGKEAEILPYKSENSERLDCPPGYSPADIAAVRITGDSLLPVFHDGWIVYFSNRSGATNTGNPSHGWQVPYNKPVNGDAYAEFIDKPCVAKLTDGRMFLRILKRGTTHGRYNLTAYNLSDIRDAEIAWAAKIVFIKTD